MWDSWQTYERVGGSRQQIRYSAHRENIPQGSQTRLQFRTTEFRDDVWVNAVLVTAAANEKTRYFLQHFPVDLVLQKKFTLSGSAAALDTWIPDGLGQSYHSEGTTEATSHDNPGQHAPTGGSVSSEMRQLRQEVRSLREQLGKLVEVLSKENQTKTEVDRPVPCRIRSSQLRIRLVEVATVSVETTKQGLRGPRRSRRRIHAAPVKRSHRHQDCSRYNPARLHWLSLNELLSLNCRAKRLRRTLGQLPV